MKKIIPLILTALSLTHLFCSGMQVTGQNVKKELQKTSESILKDKKNIYKLDYKIIGKKGYFYIVRNNGTISYHPEKALIDVDFSGYAFVRKILKERNGCLSFNLDGMNKFIFFSDLKSDGILCLAIDSIEFTDSVIGCSSNIEEKK